MQSAIHVCASPSAAQWFCYFYTWSRISTISVHHNDDRMRWCTVLCVPHCILLQSQPFWLRIGFIYTLLSWIQLSLYETILSLSPHTHSCEYFPFYDIFLVKVVLESRTFCLLWLYCVTIKTWSLTVINFAWHLFSLFFHSYVRVWTHFWYGDCFAQQI